MIKRKLNTNINKYNFNLTFKLITLLLIFLSIFIIYFLPETLLATNINKKDIITRKYLPIFMVPIVDLKGKNDLKSVFLNELIYSPYTNIDLNKDKNFILNKYNKDFNLKNKIKLFNELIKKNILKLEITVVFKDEDHPDNLKDFFYDIYRRFKYHRVDDVETFFIYYEILKNPFIKLQPLFVFFPDTYSYNQKFLEKHIKHYSDIIKIEDFKLIGKRPIIFINTWNHLFSNRNNNKNLELIDYSNYNIYKGSRQFVESTYR